MTRISERARRSCSRRAQIAADRVRASRSPSRSARQTPARPRWACIALEQGTGLAGGLRPRATRSGWRRTASSSRATPRRSSTGSARTTAATVRWSARWPDATSRGRISAGSASRGAWSPSARQSWAACRMRRHCGRSRRNSWAVRTPRTFAGARSSLYRPAELSRWIPGMRGAAAHGNDNWSPRIRRSELGVNRAEVIGACAARRRAACQTEARRILAGRCRDPRQTIRLKLERIRTASRAARSETRIPRAARTSPAAPPKSRPRSAEGIRRVSAARTRRAVRAPRAPRSGPVRIIRAICRRCARRAAAVQVKGLASLQAMAIRRRTGCARGVLRALRGRIFQDARGGW